MSVVNVEPLPTAWTASPVVASAQVQVPLTELEGSYGGQSGGLYGDGSNVPDAALMEQALKQVREIQLLDARGRVSARGRIGVVAIGPSTTEMQFSKFLTLARRDREISSRVALVNGGQAGMVSQSWAGTSQPWGELLSRLRRTGISPRQVQVLWLKAEHLTSWRYGDFPAHTRAYASDLTRILNRAKATFPNLKIAYVSSSQYYGYSMQPTVAEPTAYEAAFAVRSLIEAQAAGDPALNTDASIGPVRAPLVLWGPYLWADGSNPRADGLTWLRQDYYADGVHPSRCGTLKIARLLLDFLKNDPTARPWFLSQRASHV